MGPNLFSTLTTIVITFFLLQISPSLTTKPVSPETICRSTPHPDYCLSILSNQSYSDAHGFCRYSIRRSLSQSMKFNSFVNQYLKSHRNSLPTSVIRALEDCQTLAGYNLDLVTASYQTVYNVTNTTDLPAKKAENVHTFLGALLTNLDTCLDGLQTAVSSSNVENDIASSVSNDTKLHSVSLALFCEAFDVNKSKGYYKWENFNKRNAVLPNGRLNLKMSNRNRETYDRVNGRKLLQVDNQVLVSDIVVVSQDGSGNFGSINDAVAAAPNKTDGTNGYFLIYVTAGVYEEYVSIPKNKNYLMMIGDGINQTVITGNRSVVDGWTTFNSATFAVVAPNFVAVNITFRNTAGAIKHQAVAVRNGADFSAFYGCSFEGYQDTLYAHSLRQFYRECDIYGTVDFIFGNAVVVFQDCNLYPRRPMNGQFNAITAQGRTDVNQNSGTSIVNCTIRAADDLESSNVTFNTYLGRPWKEYSRTVYSESFIDSLVNPAGWTPWSGDFALSTLYYAEFDNSGPGSNTSNRVTWPGYHVINKTEAAAFSVGNFLGGDSWLPVTGVPFDV